MFIPAIKLLFIALAALLFILPVWISHALKKKQLRDELIQRFCKLLLLIVGIKLKVHGKISAERPLLVVSNHLTYMDIPVMASQFPMRFTPKSEIAKWPVIGFICRITDSVFVDRKPGKVKDTTDALHKVLQQGEVISFFPEATTGNGVHMLPFKSSFFSLAEEEFGGKKLHVQPIAMTYTHVRNLPVDSRLWHQIAWYGDAELVPHLMDFLKLGSMQLEIHFLPTVNMGQFADRKEMALHCQQVIAGVIDEVRENGHLARA
jgi:1-acyl-sn-glycerol-3-phosphate acyltransferase